MSFCGDQARGCCGDSVVFGGIEGRKIGGGLMIEVVESEGRFDENLRES
jgi:hypothetical protein